MTTSVTNYHQKITQSDDTIPKFLLENKKQLKLYTWSIIATKK